MAEDRRVRRTQKLLEEALIEVALEKGYKNITIHDVTNRADVGYRTYFRHFTGLDELLVRVAQDRLDHFYEILNIPPREVIEENPVDYFHVLGEALFKHVQQHEYAFRFLLQDSGSRFVLRPVVERARQKVEVLLQQYSGAPIPTELAANHIITSIFSLMRWWLENDMPHSPPKMGEIFTDLIVKPTWLVMTGDG